MKIEVSGEGDFLVYADDAWQVLIEDEMNHIQVFEQDGRVHVVWNGAEVDLLKVKT